MKNLIIFSFVCALGFLLSCSSIQVNQDYDDAFDFSKLKTFDFFPSNPGSKMSQLNERRVKKALDAQLTAKGYSKFSTNPDFLIALHSGAQQKTDINNYGYGLGWHGWGMGGVDVYQYEEGTLIVDFIDSKSKNLVWRGTARSILPNNPSPEQATDLINKVVAKILEKFPPKP